jgi:catechol 2,3-dioxygenase-like lactoylglutathione lyase family enzyme
MKRLHVHIHVTDLEQSIGFYSHLFGAEPSVLKADYAKWMLDDPRVNFAISNRQDNTGVDHLGIQFDDPAEFARFSERIHATDAPALDQEQTKCCYARSDKTWVTDPAGVAWETFHTHELIDTFGEGFDAQALAAAEAPCCKP